MKFKQSLNYTEKDFENLQNTFTTLATGFGTIAHKLIDNHERKRIQEDSKSLANRLLESEKNHSMEKKSLEYETKIKVLEEHIKRLESLLTRDNSPTKPKKG